MKIGDSPKKEASSSSSVAMERVPGSGVVELLMLTKGGYQEWALVMQVSLEALELWDAVEEESVERAKDRRALATILRGVPPEMRAGLAVKKTAKEVWASVKKMRGGDGCVKEANVQRLMKEFELPSFGDGETVAEFAVRVERLTARLGDLGVELDDSRVVRKVLLAVPRRLKQVAVSIEIHGDLNKMTLDELVGQLQVAEDADTKDELVAGAAINCCSLGSSARLVRAGVEAVGVVTTTTMEVTATTTTAAARARDAGEAAIEAGASSVAGAGTWRGSARRRRRRSCSPALMRSRRSCEDHLHHVAFRGRLLEINASRVCARELCCVGPRRACPRVQVCR
jgi:hypothetical protein